MARALLMETEYMGSMKWKKTGLKVDNKILFTCKKNFNVQNANPNNN